MASTVIPGRGYTNQGTLGSTTPRGRPAKEPHQGKGLIVKLARETGLTSKKFLTHPFFFQLPPLEEYSVEEEALHAEFATVGRGTFSRSSGRGLRTVTFDTAFLSYDASFLVWNGSFDPMKLTKELRGLMETLTPFWLHIGYPAVGPAVDVTGHVSTAAAIDFANGGPNWDLSMLATMRTLRFTEKAGEPDAKYINVAFSEWRDSSAPRRGRPGARGTTRHVVVNSDGKVSNLKSTRRPVTLHIIAREMYGKPGGWKRLRTHNHMGGIGADDSIPDWLKKHKKKRISIEVLPLPPANATKASDGTTSGKPGP